MFSPNTFMYYKPSLLGFGHTSFDKNLSNFCGPTMHTIQAILSVHSLKFVAVLDYQVKYHKMVHIDLDWYKPFQEKQCIQIKQAQLLIFLRASHGFWMT